MTTKILALINALDNLVRFRLMPVSAIHPPARVEPGEGHQMETTR
jgi:hypothetical protein